MLELGEFRDRRDIFGAAETGKGRSLLTLALTMAVIGSAIASAVILRETAGLMTGQASCPFGPGVQPPLR